MEVNIKQKIGTHFKKENIFLCTLSANNTDTKEMLKSKIDGKIPNDLLSFFVDTSVISFNQYDVFYKDDMGYTRFVEEGPETFAGDNSDKKGFIRNVVSIWDYYSEEQVFECMLNNQLMAICVSDTDPLNKYINDCNK